MTFFLSAINILNHSTFSITPFYDQKNFRPADFFVGTRFGNVQFAGVADVQGKDHWPVFWKAGFVYAPVRPFACHAPCAAEFFTPGRQC